MVLPKKEGNVWKESVQVMGPAFLVAVRGPPPASSFVGKPRDAELPALVNASATTCATGELGGTVTQHCSALLC